MQGTLCEKKLCVVMRATVHLGRNSGEKLTKRSNR